MSYVAIIEGIAGGERFLKGRTETPEEKAAQRFRSERAAEEAARRHIQSFPPVIQRAMRFKVEPRA